LLGDALGRSGHQAQANAVFKRAITLNHELADDAARLALARSPNTAREIVPPGPRGSWVLRALARVTPERERAFAFARDAARWPGAPADATVELLRRSLASTDAECQAVLDAPCLEAIHVLRRGLAEDAAPGVMELDAEILAHEGKAEQAFAFLDGVCGGSLESLPCLSARVRYGQTLKVSDQLRAMSALVNAACVAPDRCVAAYSEVAEALRARGELALSLTQLREGARRVGRPELWLKTAEVAAQTQNLLVLREALDELSRLGQPPPPALLQSAQALERSRLVPHD
jgi:hypothetical protein